MIVTIMARLLQLSLLGCLFFSPSPVSPSALSSRLCSEPVARLPLLLLSRGGSQAEQREASGCAIPTILRGITLLGGRRNMLRIQGLRGGACPEHQGGGGEADMEDGDPQTDQGSSGDDEVIDGDEEGDEDGEPDEGFVMPTDAEKKEFIDSMVEEAIKNNEAPGMTKEEMASMAQAAWNDAISNAEKRSEGARAGSPEMEESEEEPQNRAAKRVVADPDVQALRASMKANRGSPEEAEWHDLFDAVRDGEDEYVSSVLSVKPELAKHVEESTGITALHWAAAEKRLVHARLLVEAGALVNAPDMDGKTPLVWAARNRDGEELVRLLLKGGADPSAADDMGRTPLHWSVAARCHASIYALVEAGSDQSAKTKENCAGYHGEITPIEAAACGEDTETVSLLASLGSSLDFLSLPAWKDSPLQALVANPPKPAPVTGGNIITPF